MAERHQKSLRPKALKQDDSIMGTNSSSITSKRSVERLYFPNETHFFRHFVKKPQRRAPLINRGYWLRMKAIDHVVHQFLEEKSEKPKVVVNLGCGYDPLPWQCLTRYRELCTNVKFVDVDFEDLMLKKRDSVTNVAELSGMLTNLSSGESPVILSSDQYFQVACDLRDLSKLSMALSSVFDLEECLVLFSAEVSITYMNLHAADALIRWTGTLPDSRFCLLEQILPEGVTHPFAQTMLAHFDKLQTPLGSVHKYPTTADQEKRFSMVGWVHVRAVNLWELWASSDLDFLTPSKRKSLDEIEPFDEWEEFALFGCHYTLLIAENGLSSHSTLFKLQRCSTPLLCSPVSLQVVSALSEYQRQRGCRRFAAAVQLRSTNRRQDTLGNFAGMGLNSRSNSYDVYSLSSGRPFHGMSPSIYPSSRMCHTITDLGDMGAILIGGRTSPDNALADCWIFDKWTNTWERIDDLPIPRYRHTVASIGRGRAIVIGGKTNSANVVDDVLLWDRRNGWVKVEVIVGKNTKLQPCMRFGAILCHNTQDQHHSTRIVSGFLAGGMSPDGVVLQDCWVWKLDEQDEEHPVIKFEISSRGSHEITSLARFGATTVIRGESLIIIGGINDSSLIPREEEIVSIDVSSINDSSHNLIIEFLVSQFSMQRPLLTGISASLTGDNLVIMGGGAVCFSFGTYWNKGCYTVAFEQAFENQNSSQPNADDNLTSPNWKYVETIEITGKLTSLRQETSPSSARDVPKLVEVARKRITSRADFQMIVSAATPIILEGLNLGTCTEFWTMEYLKDQIGKSRQVIVHKTAKEQMSFVPKNFEYVSMPFGQFLDAVDQGEKLYLRSLSEERPSELPADITRDFPAIAADFILPQELGLVKETAHSSPLRISGPVNMWLHYDVMANVLCQIRGPKRLVIFPPCDVKFLEFSPGASSSSIDVFKNLENLNLCHTNPHEAVLKPGDVLYLPALWLHAASPTQGLSVAVNVFFKSLTHGYAPGRDIYGNRDLQAYEKGRQDIARISKSFETLPAAVRTFYMVRLAEELSRNAGVGK